MDNDRILVGIDLEYATKNEPQFKDANADLEKMLSTHQKAVESQKQGTAASKEYEKQLQQIAKFQENSGKNAADIAKDEAQAYKDLASGAKNYAQIIKEQRTTTEALYTKKQTLIKIYGEESKEVAEVTKALEASTKAAAKFEDESNSMKNSIKALHDEMTPLEKSIEKGTEGFRNFKKELADSKKEAANALATMKDLESQGQKNTEAYKKQAAAYQELAGKIDDIGDLMQELATTTNGGMEKFEQMSSTLGQVGNIASNIGGDLGNLVGSFSGLGASVSDFRLQMDNISASGAKGFSAFAQTAVAGIATIGPAVMMAVDALDNMIASEEKATIEAGKAATAMKTEFDAYQLGEKSLTNRADLIKKIGETNQDMANKLMASVGDVKAFDKALEQANEELKKTRELGAAQEWDTKRTGGGLLGWVNKLGTDLEVVFANAGKAKIAIDDMNAGGGKVASMIGGASSAMTDAVKANTQKILDLNIQILEAEGKKNEAQKLRMQMLKNEHAAMIENHNLAIKNIEMEKMKVASSQADIARAVQAINKTMYSDENMGFGFAKGKKGAAATIFWKMLGVKNEEEFQQSIDFFRGQLENGLRMVSMGAIKSLEGLQDYLAKTTGIDVFKDIVTSAKTLTSSEAREAPGWLREIRENIIALYDIKPQELQGKTMIDNLTTEMEKLKNQIPEMESQFGTIEKLTQKIWDLANKPPAQTKPGAGMFEDLKDSYEALLNAFKKPVESGLNLVFIGDQFDRLQERLAKIRYDNTQAAAEERKIIEDLLRVVNGAYQKILDNLKQVEQATLDAFDLDKTNLNRLIMGWGESIPDVNEKLKLMNAEVDRQIDMLEELYRANGKLGDAQEKYLEDKREEWKEINRQTVAAEGSINRVDIAEQGTLKTTEQIAAAWAKITGKAKDYTTILDDWQKRFDPAGYQRTLEQRGKDDLARRIQDLANDQLEAIKALNAGGVNAELKKQIKEALGLDLTGDIAQDAAIISKYFDTLKGYLVDLAKPAEVAAKGVGNLKNEVEDLKKKLLAPIEFDQNSFMKQLDEIINPKSGIDKIKDMFAQIGQLENEAAAKRKEAHKTLLNDLLGATPGDAQDKDAQKKYFQKLLDIAKEYGQKITDIAKQTAIDATKAWVDESKKLEQMQQALADRLKAREIQAGDARTNVADYVRRYKLTTQEREAEDLAKGLAKEYQSYLEAGVKEEELAEWLAIRKHEILTGKDAATTEAFGKEWGKRKEQAEKFAEIQNKAWDDQTKKMRGELQAQIDLVNELKKFADEARKIMLSLLGLTPEAAAALEGAKTGMKTRPEGGGMGQIGVMLQDGMRYSQVKSKLRPDQMPSQDMLARIGTYGVIDLVYRNGAWATLHSDEVKGESKPGEKSGEPQQGAKELGIAPVISSDEIAKRIELYPKLQEAATTAINAIKQMFIDIDKIMIESFDLLKPKKEEPFYKELINAFTAMGKDLGKAITQPLIDIIDPVTGTLTKKMSGMASALVAQWTIGLSSKQSLDNIDGAMRKFVDAVAKWIETHSPPKHGKLKDIQVWGYDTGSMYVKEFGTGINEGISYVSGGLSNLGDTLQGFGGTITKTANYSGNMYGQSVADNTSNIRALEDYRDWLLQNPDTITAWADRSKAYASKDMEFNAFAGFTNLQAGKARMDAQNADLATSDKVGQFYKWFNKNLLSPDIGEMSLDILERQVADKPFLKIWNGFHDQLKQQYPEIFEQAVAKGLITPKPAVDITENGLIIGKKQTGDYGAKYGADYLETNFEGATGFNDWLQAYYNDWLKKGGQSNMLDTITGRSLSSSGYKADTERDYFLEGWSEKRLAEITGAYQDYVKGLGTVKEYGKTKDELIELFGSTTIGKQISEGADINKILTGSIYADSLWTNGDKDRYRDKVIGGGWYDETGKEISLDGGRLNAVSAYKAVQATTRLGHAKSFSDPTIGGKIEGWLGKGWELTKAGNDYLPFAIIDQKDFDALRKAGVDVSTFRPDWMTQKEYDDLIKSGKVPVILSRAFLETSGLGEWFSEGKIEAASTAMSTPASRKAGNKLGDLTYRDKIQKGDYAGGVESLARFTQGMGDDNRKLIMEKLAEKINSIYSDKQWELDQSQVGGGIVEGDYIKEKGKRGITYDNVRKSAMAYMADALGFSKEYSVARGWRNALNSDPDKVAMEEVLKVTEAVSNELIKEKMAQAKAATARPDEQVQATTDFLKDILNKGGLNHDTLQQVQASISTALQLGLIDKEQAATIIDTIIPDAAKMAKQMGLTSFRGGTTPIGDYDYMKAILSSPWATTDMTTRLAGRRQFIPDEYLQNPLLDWKYSPAYQIMDNPFRYYEGYTPGGQWQEGTPWIPMQSPEMPPMQDMPGQGGFYGGMFPPGGGIISNVYDSPSHTFSSGSGNNYYFNINISKLEVKDGTDFVEKISDKLTDWAGLLGADL